VLSISVLLTMTRRGSDHKGMRRKSLKRLEGDVEPL
jgi:hypothetical protein